MSDNPLRTPKALESQQAGNPKDMQEPRRLILRDLFSFSLKAYRKLRPIVETTSQECRVQWEEESGRLTLWGEGFAVLKGELDSTFIQCRDKHLRESTILSLCNIAKALACYESLCGKTPALSLELAEFMEAVKDQVPPELGLDLEFDDLSEASSEAMSDTLEDIKDSINCLYDLGPSIEELFLSRENTKVEIHAVEQKTQPVPEPPLPSQFYASNIIDKFPAIELSLAQVLGEINWVRRQRLKQWSEAQEERERECEDVKPAPAAPQEKDSGVGDSVFTFQAPIPQTQHNPFSDTRSELSATSFGTANTSVSGQARVPRPPVPLVPGVKFECNICFRQLVGVDTKLLWKKHVLRDLQPYSCLFTSCPERGQTFSSRRLWVAHEFKNHRPQYTSQWRCSNSCGRLFDQRENLERHILQDHLDGKVAASDIDDIVTRAESKCVLDTIQCPFCSEKIKETKSSIQLHIGTHMDEIALKALPLPDDDSSSISSQDSLGSPASEIPNSPDTSSPPSFGSETASPSTSVLHLNQETADLHWACTSGLVADVESILEQGITTELLNSEGEWAHTPIHLASKHGHLDVIKVLVKYGAQLDVQSRIDSKTPLLLAAEGGHVPVAKYLLRLGADPRKLDNKGRNCLHAADEGGILEELRHEIEAPIKTEKPNHESGPETVSPSEPSPPSDAELPRHGLERPEKCPVPTCIYSKMGFIRKDDCIQHTLTHYKALLVCPFCPASDQKRMNQADRFMSHLYIYHIKPGNSDVRGECSLCAGVFTTQQFRAHLENCLVQEITRGLPNSEASENAKADPPIDKAAEKLLNSKIMAENPTSPSAPGLPHPLSNATSIHTPDMEDVSDAEDDVTRCVCGHQEEYQGGDDDQTESDGLFIQCDLCKVWQHGFCVGITNMTTPDNYYCEECKPELHREGLNKSGLKTSIYLHAQEEEPTPSKPSAKETNQKRRTTMNSRDAEYDDEVLKRMLEVSKQEARANAESNRGARGRERGSSEEPKESKRSRTSDSPESTGNAIVDSSDEKPAKSVVNAPSSRKARGTTTNIPVQNPQLGFPRNAGAPVQQPMVPPPQSSGQPILMPEKIAILDMKEADPSFVALLNNQVPPQLKKWGEMKQWAQQNNQPNLYETICELQVRWAHHHMRQLFQLHQRQRGPAVGQPQFGPGDVPRESPLANVPAPFAQHVAAMTEQQIQGIQRFPRPGKRADIDEETLEEREKAATGTRAISHNDSSESLIHSQAPGRPFDELIIVRGHLAREPEKFFLRYPVGTLEKFAPGSAHTVGKLRRDCALLFGVEAAKLFLVYAGRELADDDVTLPEVGIIHGACVKASTDIPYFLEQFDPDLLDDALTGMAQNLGQADSPITPQTSDRSFSNDLSAAQGRTLQDYQMQLMLLDQQNKRRLMMARQKQYGIDILDDADRLLHPQPEGGIEMEGQQSQQTFKSMDAFSTFTPHLTLQRPNNQQSSNHHSHSGDDSSSSVSWRGDSTKAAKEKEEMGEEEGDGTCCYCNQVRHGEMVTCDGEGCERKWFHVDCVALNQAPKGKAKRYCRDCATGLARKGWSTADYASFSMYSRGT